MRVFAFVGELPEIISPFSILAASVFCMAAGFFFAIASKKSGFFLPFQFFAGGVCFCAAVLSQQFSSKDLAVYLSALVAIDCFLYLCLLGIAHARTALARRKKLRERADRASVFTLPDRENSFVRDRLNLSSMIEEKTPSDVNPTAIKNANEVSGDDTNENYFSDKGLGEKGIRLVHVRGMLMKLKNAPLSAGDRLETENISRLITFYAGKDRLSVEDMRSLNDCLSAVLKMTAKYSL